MFCFSLLLAEARRVVAAVAIDFEDEDEQGDLEDEMAVVDMDLDEIDAEGRPANIVMDTVRSIASDSTEVGGCRDIYYEFIQLICLFFAAGRTTKEECSRRGQVRTLLDVSSQRRSLC